jgi:hypothetical protein
MKTYLKQKYYWWTHLIWSLKKLVYYAAIFDTPNFNEAWIWTKIHLSYKGQRIE